MEGSARLSPYRKYMQWLQRQDVGKAEGYWREALKGMEGPTRLGMSRTVRSGGGYGQRELAITGERWERIQKFAREQRLTVNTLVQAGWGWLLSRYSGGEKDVVFGATVAGRPGELAGVEGMVGVFINTLPVRVRMRDRRWGEGSGVVAAVAGGAGGDEAVRVCAAGGGAELERSAARAAAV